MERRNGNETEREVTNRLKDKIKRATRLPGRVVLYTSKDVPVITLDKPTLTNNPYTDLREAAEMEQVTRQRHIVVSYRPAKQETITSGIFIKRRKTVEVPTTYSVALNTPIGDRMTQRRLIMQEGYQPHIYEVIWMDFGETVIPVVGSENTRSATVNELIEFDEMLEDPGTVY